MTVDEVKHEIPDFEIFASICCDFCKAEAYCPSYCKELEKAKLMPYDKILLKYAEYDGDLTKVWKYIKRHKAR